MSKQAITRAHVGETVEAVLDVPNALAGDVVKIDVLAPDGAVLATLDAPVSGGVARAPWRVDLGARLAPLAVTFVARLAGERVQAGSLDVVAELRVGASGFVSIGGASAAPAPGGGGLRIDFLIGAKGLGAEEGGEAPRFPSATFSRASGNSNVVVAREGDQITLRFEISDSSGQPVRGSVDVKIQRFLIDNSGARVSPPADVFADTFNSNAKGIQAITLEWTATFSGPRQCEFDVAIQWMQSGAGATLGQILVAVPVKLTLHDGQRPITTDASEDGRAWSGDFVVHKLPLMSNNLVPSNGVFADLLTIDDGPISVLRFDPHQINIDWTVTPTIAGTTNTVGPSNRALELDISGRARQSIWGQTTFLMFQNRRGEWQPHDPFIAAGENVLDDYSLLRTVVSRVTRANPRDPSSRIVDIDVALDPLDIRSADGYKRLIRACHAHRIQVLAGFSLQGNDNPLAGPNDKQVSLDFNEWLSDVLDLKKSEGPLPPVNQPPVTDNLPPSSQKLQAFAQKLVDFVTRSSDFSGDDKFDGISFDIEWVFGRGTLKERAVVFAELFQRVAALLTQSNGVCAIATANLAAPDSQRKKVKFAPLGLVIAIPYEIALGAKNILIRPMAYDGFGNDQLDWHREIVEFAISASPGPRLHPSQFQLGVKTTPVGGGFVRSGAELLKHCSDVFRPNRVGFCVFALSGSPIWLAGRSVGGGTSAFDFTACNGVLNAGQPNAGAKAGMPMHVPLSDGQLAAFARARAGGPTTALAPPLDVTVFSDETDVSRLALLVEDGAGQLQRSVPASEADRTGNSLTFTLVPEELPNPTRLRLQRADRAELVMDAFDPRHVRDTLADGGQDAIDALVRNLFARG